jgi:GntR family transcriptional regulator
MQGQEKKKVEHPFIRLQVELDRLIRETKPGDRLLSEPQLAKELGVSRATLREGMRTFEAQGRIRRRQGVGTFVVGETRVIESGLEVLESIERLAGRIDLKVSMSALEVSDIKAENDVAQYLDVPPGTPLVRVSRVIYTDNRPIAYLVDILPPDILSSKELAEGFTGSVLDFLQTRKHPQLSQSFTDIRAVAAPSAIAKMQEIQRADVLLLFTARLYDDQSRVIDYSLSYFLPGYFRFHVIRRLSNGLPGN